MQAWSSHDIYEALYRQIMSLELKPGATLRENSLCERFGVSRTAVWKVIRQLKEAGYVIARRTVAKYREQLGIPVARMRKEI